MSEANEIIAALGLMPHPEGGHYRETLRDGAPDRVRAHSTAIYFLLKGGERSRWHRIDALEVWHFYRGAPMELVIAVSDAPMERCVLGGDLGRGERPQIAVPAGAWQAARSLGAYSLVGCTVAPGFEFSGFELAPDGFAPDWD